MANSLFQSFAKIPATFWSVVAGSLFSLIGTLTGITLTNRASDRRSREQLKNDRRLKNHEREMAFRKETYAAAAEAIAVSMSALARFSDLSVSIEKLSSIYADNSPALTKVNLVAGEETLCALTNFGAEFAGAFSRLARQRMILNVIKERIEVESRLLRGFEKTRDAMVELMRHHNIEGLQDSSRFAAIQSNYDFEANRIEMSSKTIQEMAAELTAKHLPFIEQCRAESASVMSFTIPLLVAARGELDLSISKERYAEILHQAQAKQKRHLDEFLQSIKPEDTVVPS